MATQKLYYLQHGYVGNAMCWWRTKSRGYSSNIKEAEKYTEKEAKEQAAMRPGEDIAWPCDYIDGNEQAHKIIIDAQYVDSTKSICRKRRPYKKEKK